MWPSAQCGNYISHFLCANSIWKSFLKYEWCPCMDRSRASLKFQKRFPDTVNTLRKSIRSLHSVLLVTYSNNKAKNNNLKNTKKMSTEIILRCTQCCLSLQAHEAHPVRTKSRPFDWFICSVFGYLCCAITGICAMYYAIRVRKCLSRVHEKTRLRGFRPGTTQTGLYSHRRGPETWNFGFKK